MIPSFSGLSYIELDLAMDARNTRLHISFKPSSPDGYLLYAGNVSEEIDFLSLSLVDGRLQLQYDLGSGVVLLSSDPLALNVWHMVFIFRELMTATMTVDGVEFGPVSSPGAQPTRCSCSGEHRWAQRLQHLVSYGYKQHIWIQWLHFKPRGI